MKDARVVPFEPRPASQHDRRVERAAERRVEESERRHVQAAINGPFDFGDWLTTVHIDPDAERPTPVELVYRVSDGNHGIVFTTPERARYVSSLFDALDSKTWGEFRSRIPAEEWELLAEFFDEVPPPEKLFESEAVPGYCDGDWPPWLQKEIILVLPPPLVKKYAEAVMSCINGVYFNIKQEDLPALLAELESRGIRAVHEPDLYFN